MQSHKIPGVSLILYLTSTYAQLQFKKKENVQHFKGLQDFSYESYHDQQSYPSLKNAVSNLGHDFLNIFQYRGLKQRIIVN